MIRRLLPVTLLLAVLLPGCGYSLGRPPALGGAHTLTAPVFENRTFRRDVELDLARHLVSAVKARTDLVMMERGGDLVVDGAILEIKELVLSQREGQRVRESSVLITVQVKVIDGRTGEELVPRREINERESFVPLIGESLRSARAEALRRVAESIVDLLEAGRP